MTEIPANSDVTEFDRAHWVFFQEGFEQGKKRGYAQAVEESYPELTESTDQR